MKHQLVIIMVLLCAVALPLPAAELGDPSPQLEVSRWIKNDPGKFRPGQDGRIYVVEFWATWCPPCRKSIPHLTELQKKYRNRNVVVIGISNEEDARVKSYVRRMGRKMEYAVAVDRADQSTTKNFMRAFRRSAIPTAFIIDHEGKVAWVGHPMAMDLPLAVFVARRDGDKRRTAMK